MSISHDYDVTALGELLVDFTESGVSERGNLLFEANPGGAPCNFLAMLAKLGRRTAFIGKVGDDVFGRMLCERVAGSGIDVSGVKYDAEVPTTLAIVHNTADGDREFAFYRNPGADLTLRAEEVDMAKIASSGVFHFGTLSTTSAPARAATYAAVEYAKRCGCVISFDPNLRLNLWPDAESAREQIACGLSRCDVLKISDDEVEFMTGEKNIYRGVEILLSKWNIPLVLATMGAGGSCAFYRGTSVFAPPFRMDSTVDATGAGDTFGGCAVHFVLKYGLDALDEARLTEMLTFANAAAALITTRQGALCAMPEPKEVLSLINSR
ncbi:PfkB family carbohydrate kinase [Cloacibacillus sp. An23]|uniref:PfkB family carbohydrate kinase n=1 Tax=Cloacibacillus sp. An23 TaxID=1965591 RepID=UPI000B3A8102|nr:PfkB family carbohydrate kinase [Cloacibacillus sp. An23]OUO94431.1 carbohydrate kinase [Cloacibacillus sp. An23]